MMFMQVGAAASSSTSTDFLEFMDKFILIFYFILIFFFLAHPFYTAHALGSTNFLSVFNECIYL